ncbi:19009_t:CDS:2 [Funneliformis geosporum]|uniref:19009_t:CDS:1 n=1 Tax=Funneliformis geosporum TaxID=1117311 RepID=A0A9W4SCT2_9GLOM|nr:19009_t:CDS:2 [Funneliformis geosporum]
MSKKITGRVKPLSLKSTPEFHQRLKTLASEEKCLMIEILEQAMELYEKDRKKAEKENTVPQISQAEVPQRRVDKRPFREIPNGETETRKKLLENKKNRKNFLEAILCQTDPYTKKRHAKLNSFVNYDRAEREKLNRQIQRLEKEIAELEGLIKKRC